MLYIFYKLRLLKNFDIKKRRPYLTLYKISWRLEKSRTSYGRQGEKAEQLGREVAEFGQQYYDNFLVKFAGTDRERAFRWDCAEFR